MDGGVISARMRSNIRVRASRFHKNSASVSDAGVVALAYGTQLHVVSRGVCMPSGELMEQSDLAAAPRSKKNTF